MQKVVTFSQLPVLYFFSAVTKYYVQDYFWEDIYGLAEQLRLSYGISSHTPPKI